MKLTERQRELVEHVVAGRANKAIGLAMNVTEGTVKIMLHLLYERFGVPNRTTLAMLYARKHENQDTPRRASAARRDQRLPHAEQS